MEPKLNVEGKLALLEQALRCLTKRDHFEFHSRCFPKILFLNKSFIAIARLYSVYRFALSIWHHQHVIWLEQNNDNQTISIIKSMEAVRRLFRFLNPPFFVAYDYDDATEQEYVDLLKNSSCKIGIVSAGYGEDASLSLISRIWSRITELYLGDNQDQHLDNLPINNFDEFIVSAESIDRLEKALRHNTKKLELWFDPDFKVEGLSSRISNFTVGKIDKCTIAPSLLLCNREAMLSLVKGLINVLQPHLKILDLQPDHLNRGLENMDEVFVSDVEFLIALAKVIDDAGLKSNIDACIRYIPHQPVTDYEINQLENLVFDDFQVQIKNDKTFICATFEHKIGASDIKMRAMFYKK